MVSSYRRRSVHAPSQNRCQSSAHLVYQSGAEAGRQCPQAPTIVPQSPQALDIWIGDAWFQGAAKHRSASINRAMSAESKHQAQTLGMDLDNPLGFGDPRVSISGMNFHANWCSGRIWVFSSGFVFGCLVW